MANHPAVKLRLEILFLGEVGPFFGPVDVAEGADPGGPLVEEAVVGGLDPVGAEDGRAGEGPEVGIGAFEGAAEEGIAEEELGEGVTSLKVGDRIAYGVGALGAYARGEVNDVSPWRHAVWPHYALLALGVAGLALQVLCEGIARAKRALA